jgi:glycosyltransferase involved in cell wall biosynthesis
VKSELVVHVTNEAGIKKGGIGATLYGLLSLDLYHEDVARTVLLGPFNRENRTEFKHLVGNVDVHYLAHDGINRISEKLSGTFAAIEKRYGVEILYGVRFFQGKHVEILLIDGSYSILEHLNLFKSRIYEEFAFSSDKYESNPIFEKNTRIAIPGLRALYALTGLRYLHRKMLLIHDIAAIPVMFASKILDFGLQNCFFLHEVPCARDIVEFYPGHDIRFYTHLKSSEVAAKIPPAYFSDCRNCYKYALMKQIPKMDQVFSVGGLLKDELAFFLGISVDEIQPIFRGLPNYSFEFEEMLESREKIVEYAASLVGFRPDYIFTHVSRMVPSKAVWRDIQVLEHLDKKLAEIGKRGIHLFLSTSIPEGRHPEDVHKMEKEYGWPVNHRSGFPDLVSYEENCYKTLVEFNKSATAIRAVLVNQFGWSQERCGQGVPEDMTFHDLRRGSHAEFGLSMYEPFGIGQLETLVSGTISVLSSSCGSIELLRKKTDFAKTQNIIVADYMSRGQRIGVSSLRELHAEGYEKIEKNVARDVAKTLFSSLPKSEEDERALLINGRKIAGRFSWKNIYETLYRPAFFK